MSVYAKSASNAWLSLLRIDRLRARVNRLASDRAAVLSLFLLGALIAFELFNYSTTEFALSDLLGGLKLGKLQWATILAVAFSAMDFAGIAWLFTPGHGRGLDAWYLIAAWLLAATMNALLTWWSVSLALVSHQPLGDLIIGRQAMLRGVPIFVALLVWLLRILLIGSFTLRAPASGRARPRPAASVRAGRRRVAAAGRTPARLVRRRPEFSAPSAYSPAAPARRAHPR